MWYKYVQLEEDGGGSTRQSWMETSGLWPMKAYNQEQISIGTC